MNLPEAIDRIKPAIVQIIFQECTIDMVRGSPIPQIPKSTILGTGFFVSNEGHVITARHVVEAGRELIRKSQADMKNIVIGLGLPNTDAFRGNFTIMNIQIADEDIHNDLCLIQTTRNPFTEERKPLIKTKDTEFTFLLGTADINPNRPQDGAAIGISGYPFEKTVLINNSGVIATSWDYLMKHVQTTEIPMPIPKIFDRYIGDVEVNPGNSGGPVYLEEDASVIGVCVSNTGSNIWTNDGSIATILGNQLFYSSGLTTIIPSKYIIELLEKHGIDMPSAEPCSG